MKKIIVCNEGKFEYMEIHPNLSQSNIVVTENEKVVYPFTNGARIEYYPNLESIVDSKMVIYAQNQKIEECTISSLIPLTDYFNFYAVKTADEVAELIPDEIDQNLPYLFRYTKKLNRCMNQILN